jgi:hypothetical protein
MTHPTWRGVTVDARTKAMLEEVARITPADLYVRPSQGAYTTATSASAGTHAGGGAVDLSVRDLSHSQRALLVDTLRRVGFAAWHRTTAQGFDHAHIHAIAVQPGGRDDRGVLSQAAHAQVRDFYAGRNGLASHGPDDGPRGHVGTTWETYKHPAPAQACPGTVRRGDRGPAVVAWQRAMIAHGFMSNTPQNVDGAFGPGTEGAAKRMQQTLGVTVDGILGCAQTWPALQRHHR